MHTAHRGISTPDRAAWRNQNASEGKVFPHSTPSCRCEVRTPQQSSAALLQIQLPANTPVGQQRENSAWVPSMLLGDQDGLGPAAAAL